MRDIELTLDKKVLNGAGEFGYIARNQVLIDYPILQISQVAIGRMNRAFSVKTLFHSKITF